MPHDSTSGDGERRGGAGSDCGVGDKVGRGEDGGNVAATNGGRGEYGDGGRVDVAVRSLEIEVRRAAAGAGDAESSLNRILGNKVTP